MTKEQEEEIERCKELIKETHAGWIGISNQKAIKTILSMLEEKDKEIDNLTQQIPNITRNKTYSGSFEGLLLIEEELKKRDNIITQLINELYNLAILINEEYVIDEYLLNKETIKEHFLKRKER